MPTQDALEEGQNLQCQVLAPLPVWTTGTSCCHVRSGFKADCEASPRGGKTTDEINVTLLTRKFCSRFCRIREHMVEAKGQSSNSSCAEGRVQISIGAVDELWEFGM